MDTGAQWSVIGSNQAVGYLSLSNILQKFYKANERFRFGDFMTKATHRINIISPTPEGPVTISAVIVHCDVPFFWV